MSPLFYPLMARQLVSCACFGNSRGFVTNMSKPRTPPRMPDANRTHVGLTAYGRAGGWEVSVNETLSGVERRFLQIEGPSVYLYFEILSTGILEEIARFLESPESPTSEQRKRLELGTFNGAAVDLLRDDEFANRFFF
jgi:hypothetical protein